LVAGLDIIKALEAKNAARCTLAKLCNQALIFFSKHLLRKNSSVLLVSNALLFLAKFLSFYLVHAVM